MFFDEDGETLASDEEGELDDSQSKRQRTEASMADAVANKLKGVLDGGLTTSTVSMMNTANVVLTTLNSESLRAMESNYRLSVANGITNLSLRKFICPSIVTSLGAQLVSVGLNIGGKPIDPWTYTDWLDDLSVEDFVTAMRPLVTEHVSGGEVDGVREISSLIRQIKMVFTVIQKQTNLNIWGQLYQIIKEHIGDPALLNDKNKEIMQPVRDAILFILNKTDFGREVVKDFKILVMKDKSFKEWMHHLHTMFLTLNDLAWSARRLLEKEIIEVYLKNQKSGNPSKDHPSGDSNGHTSQENPKKKPNGKKRDREENGKAKLTACKCCGRMHPGTCVLTKHPDANKESKPWSQSTKGLLWAKHDKFKSDVLPMKFCLDKKDQTEWDKERPQKMPAKSGKLTVDDVCLLNNVLYEDTTHEINTNDDLLNEKNGIRTCDLINPLDNTSLLRLKVLFDTGALGEGANYLSNQVADKLEAFGYESKQVDKVVCGCFLGSTRKITRSFKLRMRFYNKETSAFEVTTVTCDAINTRHDVIIGYDSIKRCSYFRNMMTSKLQENPLDSVKYCFEGDDEVVRVLVMIGVATFQILRSVNRSLT